jgi:predicted small lipoprotein YifL
MTAKTLAIFITASLLLAGCGNKGPLVLPPASATLDAPVPDEAPPREESAPQDDSTDTGNDEAGEPAELPEPPSAAR